MFRSEALEWLGLSTAASPRLMIKKFADDLVLMSKYRRSCFKTRKTQYRGATPVKRMQREDQGKTANINRWSGFRGMAARFTAIAGALGMGALYLGIISTASHQGFDFLDHEQRIADLKKQNQHLELRVMDLESLSRIDREAPEIGMVPASHVVYLPDDSTSAVAVVE